MKCHACRPNKKQKRHALVAFCALCCEAGLGSKQNEEVPQEVIIHNTHGQQKIISATWSGDSHFLLAIGAF